MADLPDLKPCPFCGNAELHYKPAPDPYMDERHHEEVSCRDCGASVGYEWNGSGSAIKRWNRREGEGEVNP